MLLALVAVAASAQERFERRPCMRFDKSARAVTRTLPTINQNWDPARTYRQIVLLVEFADSTFSMDDPKTYYNNLLNLTTSNTRGGVGCAVDYFRDQSNGAFNLQFDVYGPIKVSQTAKKSGTGDNYGEASVIEAIKKSIDSLHVDYSPYDWNKDGEVEQVVLVACSYGGNGGAKFTKFIWPNTGYVSSITVGENLKARQYSISTELWPNAIPHGIGTICHEFAHCLGLPDTYPVGTVSDNLPYSMVDEWDLMDGGNYTCYGWCPPNLTALEKQLMGWLSIEEISAPTKISDLKPVADGGKAYKITKEGNEFYLLENRQQSGWDKGLPGKGLTIYHVDYDATEWKYNNVNTKSKFRFQLLHADGLDYDAWKAFCNTKGISQYIDNANRMNSRYLSTSPYPFVSDTLQVYQCSETPMPLTNIQISDAGYISFDVEQASGISPIIETTKNDDRWYDLQGRRLLSEPSRKGLYIHNGKLISKH